MSFSNAIGVNHVSLVSEVESKMTLLSLEEPKTSTTTFAPTLERSRVMQSIEQGDIEVLKNVSKDVLLNLGYFPIQYALTCSRLEVATLLAHRGCLVSENAFDEVLREGSLVIVERFLEQRKGRPFDKIVPQSAYKTPSILQLLLEHGCKASQNAEFEGAISKRCAKLLMEHGQPLPKNAFWFAVDRKWRDLITPFLTYGVRIRPYDLNEAIERGDAEVYDALLARDTIPFDCFTLLHALKHNKNLVKRLLELNVPIEYQTWDHIIPKPGDLPGRTDMIDGEVIRYCREEKIFEYIIQKGKRQDTSAVYIACKRNNMQFLQAVVAAGYTIGSSALQEVVSKQVALFLLGRGACITEGAVEHACNLKMPELVEVYLEKGAKITAPILNSAISNNLTTIYNAILEQKKPPFNYWTVAVALGVGNEALARRLIELKAPVNDQTWEQAFYLYPDVDRKTIASLFAVLKPSEAVFAMFVRGKELSKIQEFVDLGVEVRARHVAAALGVLADNSWFLPIPFDKFEYLLPLCTENLQSIAPIVCDIKDHKKAFYAWKKLKEHGVQSTFAVLESALLSCNNLIVDDVLADGVSYEGICLSTLISYLSPKEAIEIAQKERLKIDSKILDAKFITTHGAQIAALIAQTIATQSKGAEELIVQSLPILTNFKFHLSYKKDLAAFYRKAFSTWENYGGTFEQYLLYLMAHTKTVWSYLFPAFDLPAQFSNGYSVWGFNPKVYSEIMEALIPWFQKEPDTDRVSSAYKLTVLFGSWQEAESYLEAFTKRYPKSKRPLHDATLFELPRNGVWDIPMWRSMMKRFGYRQNRMRLLAMASTLEKKIHAGLPSYRLAIRTKNPQEYYRNALIDLAKSHPQFKEQVAVIEQLNVKKQKRKAALNRLLFEVACELLPSDVESLIKTTTKQKANESIKERKPLYELLQAITARRNIGQYSYEKLLRAIVQDVYGDVEDRFLKFAYDCSKAGLTRNYFEEACELSIKHPKEWDYIPSVKLPGEKVGAPGYIIETVALNDPTSAILGSKTECCQDINGHARDCVLQGMTSTFGGFIKVSYPESKNDPIASQGWVAVSKNGELIIDSIERKSHYKGDIIMKLFHFAATQCIHKNPKISRVLFGGDGNTPKDHGFQLVAERPEEYSPIVGYGKKGKVGYDSCMERFCIAERGKLDPYLISLLPKEDVVDARAPKMSEDGLLLQPGTDSYVYVGKKIKGLALNTFDRSAFFQKHPNAERLMLEEKRNPLLEEGYYSEEFRDRHGEYFLPFAAIQLLVKEKFRSENCILVDNDEELLIEKLRDCVLEDEGSILIGYIVGVHAISAYVQKRHGKIRGIIIDPEHPNDNSAIKRAISAVFPIAQIATTEAKLQVDYYSCSTFLLSAFKAYSLRGRELIEQIFADRDEQEFGLATHETPALLLRMGQKIDFEALPQELLSQRASYKSNLTLAAYLEKHTVMLEGKRFNAAAIRKKYHLLDLLETVI